MAKRSLVEEDLRDGERLIRALPALGVRISDARWHYVDEAGEWRLYIDSPTTASHGPKEVYSRIQRAIHERGIGRIAIRDISLGSPDEAWPIGPRFRDYVLT